MHELILITEPALTIILEHAYFVWDQHTSRDCVTPAIAHYKASSNCDAVIQAMDAAFNAGGDDFMESIEALEKEFKQIALSNRLCRSYFQPHLVTVI
jgi:hypothetical protein